MKELKARWEAELEGRMPDLKQEILDEPIPTKPALKIVEKKKFPFKYMSWICSAAAVVVLCICIIPLLRTKDSEVPSPVQTPTPNEPIVEVAEESTMITVEINPRVVFISDKNGIVTNVVATNEDADVILATENFENLVIGKTTKEALVNYVELATKLGYINADATDNAVKITSLDSEKDTAVLVEAKEGLEDHFKTKGIYAVVIDNSVSLDKICEINEIEKTDKVENVIKDFKEREPLYAKNELDNLPNENIEEYYKNYVANNLKGDVETALNVGNSILNIWELYWELYAHFGDYWTLINQEWGTDHLPPEYKAIAEQIEQALKDAENYGIKIENKEQLEQCCRSFWDNGIALGNMEELKQEINALDKIQNYDKYKNLFGILNFDASEFDKLEAEVITKEDVEKAQDELIKKESANRIESNKDGYEKEREEIDNDSYDSYLDEIKNQYGSPNGFWDEKHQGKK